MRIFSAIVICFCLTLCGCIGVAQLDETKRKPTTQLDIYRDGAKPTKSYKEITMLNDDGSLAEQAKIEQKFIKKAKGFGGNGLILPPLVRTGSELQGFGLVDTYAYKGVVIVYGE
jgi:hypothetical protein